MAEKIIKGEERSQNDDYFIRTPSVSSFDEVFGKSERTPRTPLKNRETRTEPKKRKCSNDKILESIQKFQSEMNKKMDNITEELKDIRRENETHREALLQENIELRKITKNLQEEVNNLKEDKTNLSSRITQLENCVILDKHISTPERQKFMGIQK